MSYRFAPAVCFCHSVVCDDIWLSLWIWNRNGILVFLHLRIINMVLSTSSCLTKNESIFFHRKWCRYSLKFQLSVKLDAGKKPQTSSLPSLVLFYQEFWWVCPSNLSLCSVSDGWSTPQGWLETPGPSILYLYSTLYHSAESSSSAGIFVLCCSSLHCSHFLTADNTDATAHGFLWNTLVVMSRPEWPVCLWSGPKGRQARDGTESSTKSELFILGWCQKQRTRLNILGAAKLLR